MATGGAFKTLGENDIVSTRTLLHEAIPITGTIVSGTYGEYGTFGNEPNIKNHSHGMFQTVYDYPYLSSSANHIFDITVGVGSNSSLYSVVATQKAKKRNVYNQLAQVLAGYDKDGKVLDFDVDGNILAGGTKHRDTFIIPFSRLLVKDEIKKGSFTLKLGVGSTFASPMAASIKITDASGSDGYFVNSPAGEYGVLYAANDVGTAMHSDHNQTRLSPCGLLYYQAGIAVLSASVFTGGAAGGAAATGPHTTGLLTTDCEMDASKFNVCQLLTSSNIQTLSNVFRHRLLDVTFNNTTELNSTIYFCRAHHSEFNYSTNPTYLTGSKIRVKTNASDTPVSYITTIGLYNDNNELMAVSKLSEPLKKTPDVEFTLRVRLDY
jgi:hypothetical protein